MSDSPTYVFQDGRVFAIVAGKVVAEAADVESVEAILTTPEDKVAKAPTHIVTPNGLKGQILGRVSDMWGDEITVRFENGRISHYHTATLEEGGVEFVTEEPEAPESKSAALEARLDENFAGDKESLKERLTELASIQREAALAVPSSKYEEQQKLDGIVAMARGEAEEIKEVLAAYDSQEHFEAPAPFTFQATEQADLGGHDGSWLDQTLGEMIAEAEAVDFDAMLDEGPERLLADTDTAVLADAGATRQLASTFIRSRVAGIEEESVNEYEKAFLARVEQVRRQELYNRKETSAKEAKTASEDDYTGPDEALFL